MSMCPGHAPHKGHGQVGNPDRRDGEGQKGCGMQQGAGRLLEKQGRGLGGRGTTAAGQDEVARAAFDQPLREHAAEAAESAETIVEAVLGVGECDGDGDEAGESQASLKKENIQNLIENDSVL